MNGLESMKKTTYVLANIARTRDVSTVDADEHERSALLPIVVTTHSAMRVSIALLLSCIIMQ